MNRNLVGMQVKNCRRKTSFKENKIGGRTELFLEMFYIEIWLQRKM
jgi:hypothetical protein